MWFLYLFCNLFKTPDANYFNSHTALHSLAFDKFCILFNIAAVQSAIAVEKPVNDDDSLKSAAKLFQV